jgi:DNA-binding LytR/AlgR family response regulator
MRIAIVEDEAIVARRLERMVAALVGDPTIRVVPTLPAALDFIRATPIDVLFLDLNLNGRDGFQLLEKAAAAPFQTIVVSAHHEQALRAFDYGVTDFLAKPWTEERLRTAIDRLTAREPRGRAQRLVVRKGRDLQTIAASDIVFARGADDYAELHLIDGTVHLHEKTLATLETLLPAGFARVHRSYIVNLARARSLRTSPRMSVVMIDDSLVPIGRVYRGIVRERFAPSRTT